MYLCGCVCTCLCLCVTVCVYTHITGDQIYLVYLLPKKKKLIEDKENSSKPLWFDSKNTLK